MTNCDQNNDYELKSNELKQLLANRSIRLFRRVMSTRA